MSPICADCGRFCLIKKTGIYFTEQARWQGRWQPYKIWAGDLFKCPGCFKEVVAGVGANPIAEHYQADFAAKLKRLGADKLRVR